MNEISDQQKHTAEKRRRNCTCPECNLVFFSRKLRHKHQMVVHRKAKPDGNKTYSARRAKRERNHSAEATPQQQEAA